MREIERQEFWAVSDRLTITVISAPGEEAYGRRQFRLDCNPPFAQGFDHLASKVYVLERHQIEDLLKALTAALAYADKLKEAGNDRKVSFA